MLVGAWVRRRKAFCRLINGRKHLNQRVQLRHFQTVLNHRLLSSYPQLAPDLLQLGQAPDERSNRRAVDMRHARHVENHSRLARRDDLIQFFLQPRAFRSSVNAASHLQRRHAGLQSSF